MTVLPFVVAYLYVINIVSASDENHTSRPHIVIIMADDLGWNDVSFHGADQIPTPNIDALAYNGVILNRFYTLPSCSPSRAALLTGQHPIRYGFQGNSLQAGEYRYLPPDIDILPQKLKELGYSTQLVGKWHLGHAYRNVTPTRRGFDHHFGYWNGLIGYFSHRLDRGDVGGLDMHENFEPRWSVHNEYATTLLTRKAGEVIGAHNKSAPLFLMVSHLAPHAGNFQKLEVPDVAENDKKFGHILDANRRLYAGMVNEVDESVGSIVEALAKKQMLDNALVLFLSDNGAQTTGPYANYASSWPLRGMKLTVLEGGVRNVAILYSARLKNKSTVSNELMHISDLMPTLYAAAGGDVDKLGRIDGINQWPTLLGTETSRRATLLVNIDEYFNASALIGKKGRYKLIQGSTMFDQAYDNYYGEDGRDSFSPPYNTTAVLQSAANVAIGGNLTRHKLVQLRRDSDLGNCRTWQELQPCDSATLCLFDLLNDPCETTNVAPKYPKIVRKLSKKLAEYWKQLRPQRAIFIDPKANPLYFNNTWHTWLDADESVSLSRLFL